MTDLTNENIWELRFNAAIERFGSLDEYEYMEIPGYGLEPECPSTPILTDLQEYQENLEKRFEACKQRYRGMEEYMEIPDMDLWLKLKSEIVPKKTKLERQVCQTFYTVDQLNTINDFDPYLDEFQTTSMGMNTSDYVDDYESDYDNYNLDSIDKKERNCLRFQDEWLDGRRGRGRSF